MLMKLVRPALRRGLPGRKRRFQIYCVGTAKSGTVSLAQLFATRYRAGHEPDAAAAIDAIISFENGRITRQAFDDFIVATDRRLDLEMNSSQLNYFFIDTLVDRFEAAKFILTIRDPYSWVNSFVNHRINNPSPPDNPWLRLSELRFKPEIHTHSAEEKILKDHGFYTLDGYFAYWAAHNRRVLSVVPPDRLLVLRTDRISASLEQIAGFTGSPLKKLNASKSHSHPTRKDRNLISELDADFVRRKLRTHCDDLLQRYFPDFELPKN